ncbi:MAG: c-type cytochrome [Proteobacteria bacterium]|nr:c-type cytochrome [Pseudomonadota bacterium]
MEGNRRWWAFGLVAACFFLQALFVWWDVGPRPGSTLAIAPQARQGQALFRSHGCQSCHALYGMGGFLGPDLTNAARRVPPARLDELLQTGSGPMPAYRLGASDRAALWAYLQAVDATGQGTPPPPAADTGPPFAAALARWRAQGGEVPVDVAAGAQIVDDGACAACHRSFAVDATLRAPDLSLTFGHIDERQVRAVLAQGRGIMPAQGLRPTQTDAVVAFLRWLSAHRDELAPRRAISLRTLPWFVYPAAPAASTASDNP